MNPCKVCGKPARKKCGRFCSHFCQDKWEIENEPQKLWRDTPNSPPKGYQDLNYHGTLYD